MTDFTADLVLTNITKRYNDTTILDDLSLTVRRGNTVAVVGPSGSGKSTLLNIIGALDQPTSGVARLGTVDITALEGKELARYRASSVGFVFQDHHLLPQLTAIENVLLPTLAVGRKADAADALDLLTRVGVEHRADAFPSQMSGGERQRVAIARALINKPDLLLCDEPTGNLDASTGATVIELILEIAQQGNVTIIVVTHNPEHAARFGQCLTLRAGKLEAVNG